jgi:hypothetical protein
MLPSPTFSGNRVTVGDRSWTVPHPVAHARRIGDRVVVVYDYMSGPKHSAFHNVEAFDDEGQKLWTAEHPGTGATDAYVEFMSEDPLILWNFACFRCTIDPTTGKLLNAEFTK